MKTNELEPTNPEKLLVIGNGFDLACSLKSNISSYLDYAKNKFMPQNFAVILKEVQKYFDENQSWTEGGQTGQPRVESLIGNPNNPTARLLGNVISERINFWDLLFAERKNIDKEWNDVESEIKDVTEGLKTISIKELLMKSEYSLNSSQLKSYVLLLDILSKLRNEFPSNLVEDDNFLINELQSFENNFAAYLQEQFSSEIHSGYRDYLNESEELLQRLSGDSEYNILSFNYTQPYLWTNNEHLHTYKNVHGHIGRPDTDETSNIIFGIDSTDVSPNDSSYKFTKTYRDLFDSDASKSKDLLDSNINEIIFYGHSLSKADYSYFLSLFDHYQIYSNTNVSLTFAYNPYISGMLPRQVKEDQFKKLSSLSFEYGDTLEQNHGNNLLHKMILEGRIKIIPRFATHYAH